MKNMIQIGVRLPDGNVIAVGSLPWRWKPTRVLRQDDLVMVRDRHGESVFHLGDIWLSDLYPPSK